MKLYLFYSPNNAGVCSSITYTYKFTTMKLLHNIIHARYMTIHVPNACSSSMTFCISHVSLHSSNSRNIFLKIDISNKSDIWTPKTMNDICYLQVVELFLLSPER